LNRDQDDLRSGRPTPLDELAGIDAIIDAALAEDLHAGDVTSRCTVPRGLGAVAFIEARQDLVFAGGLIAARVFGRVDPDLAVETLVTDGRRVAAGTVLLRIGGRARAILAAERTALNLLQRSCGVATLTARYVEAADGRVRIVDTRKTMPGLRVLDRYSVRCGGAHNHRNDLGGGVLIKENHIRCAGSVTQAVVSAKLQASHALRIECEVESLDELREAIEAGADAILLDNMSNDELREAVQINDGRAMLEVSGGITLERVPELAELGVNLISVGALTHSAPAADLSLLLEV